MALIIRNITITLDFADESQGATEIEPSSARHLVAKAPQSLDQTTRQRYEALLGSTLEDVRIFADPVTSQALDLLKADAAALGNNVFIKEEQFDLESQTGQALLAHELTHVTQATRGAANNQDQSQNEQEALFRERQVRSGSWQPAKQHHHIKMDNTPVQAPVLHRAAADRTLMADDRKGTSDMLVEFENGQVEILDQKNIKKAFEMAARMIDEYENEFDSK